MAITAITVTHNSAGIIRSALDSIYEHPQIDKYIVVDNASTDVTIDTIRIHYPKVHILQNTINCGFARACNQALQMVTSEFALLLNPDALLAVDSIDILLSSLIAYPKAAIVVPMLKGDDSNKSEAQSSLPTLHSKMLCEIMPINDKNISSVPFASGAVAMWRMQYMRAVDFFDPAFFLFYEDDDISIRTLRAGYLILLAFQATAHHIPGKSCAATEELNSVKLRSSTWSYLYIHSKHCGKVVAMSMATSIAVKAAWCICRFIEFDYKISKRRYITQVKKHEEEYAKNVKEHERLYAEKTETFEKQWLIKQAILGKQDETAAIEHEKRWWAEAKKLEIQWEKEAQRLEERWVSIQATQAYQWIKAQKKKEAADKLWGALHFFCNPKYCKIHK